MEVDGCRSTSSDDTPNRESRIDAVSPTGPPPTIRTSTSRMRGQCLTPPTSVKAPKETRRRDGVCTPRETGGEGGNPARVPPDEKFPQTKRWYSRAPWIL